jgi:hypothetical protein
MYRFTITFTLCFTMDYAPTWETFPKYGVGFSRGNYLECGKWGAGV